MAHVVLSTRAGECSSALPSSLSHTASSQLHQARGHTAHAPLSQLPKPRAEMKAAHAHGWVAARASTRPSHFSHWHRHDRVLRGLSSAHPAGSFSRLSSVHTLARARPQITSQTSPLGLETLRVPDFELKASEDASAPIVPILGNDGYNEWHHISHQPLPLDPAAILPTFHSSSSSSSSCSSSSSSSNSRSSSSSSTEPYHSTFDEDEVLDGSGPEVDSELSKRLFSVQVLTKEEQLELAATPAHPAALTALYMSHSLNCLGEHAWRFLSPALLSLLHQSLLPVACASFIGQLVIFLGAPWVGHFMDSTPRVAAFNTLCTVQTAAMVVTALATLYGIRHPPAAGLAGTSLLRQPWFLAVMAAGAVDRLTGLASGVAFERDWVILLAGQNRPIALASANAILRRVDLVCELAGPISFGWLLSRFTPGVCLQAAIAVSLISLPILLLLVRATDKLSRGALSRPRPVAGSQSSGTPTSNSTSDLSTSGVASSSSSCSSGSSSAYGDSRCWSSTGTNTSTSNSSSSSSSSRCTSTHSHSTGSSRFHRASSDAPSHRTDPGAEASSSTSTSHLNAHLPHSHSTHSTDSTHSIHSTHSTHSTHSPHSGHSASIPPLPSEQTVHSTAEKPTSPTDSTDAAAKGPQGPFVAALKGWKTFLGQSVLPASLAYVLLYFNAVLSPGGLMTSFLTQRGVDVTVVGAFRGACAAMGLAATFVSAPLVSRLGLLNAGAASLIFQTLLLAASVAVFFASPAHNTPLLMLFLGLVVLSRLGAWVYDVVDAQIFQTAVPSSEANLVGTTEIALASLAELVMLGAAIVCHDITHFGQLALLSMGSVLAATVIYCLWLARPDERRSALFPVRPEWAFGRNESEEGGAWSEGEGSKVEKEMQEWEGTPTPVKA